jgi:hypothetical protein
VKIDHRLLSPSPPAAIIMHTLRPATKRVCTRRVLTNDAIKRRICHTQPHVIHNIRRTFSTVMTTRESASVSHGHSTSSTSSANSDPPPPTTPNLRPTNSSHTLSDQEWDILTGPSASLPHFENPLILLPSASFIIDPSIP